MVRRYKEKHYNRITGEFDEIAAWSFAIYPGDNEHITICRNDGKSETTRNIKVVPDSDYTFKLEKTQIRAKSGAKGLYDFLDDCLFNEFCEVWAWKVLHHCMENMKIK